MGIKLTGFEEALNRLSGMQSLMQRNLSLATKQNVVLAQDSMKLKIRNGDPSWARLSMLTVRKKQSSKPLIDHADLMNSIKGKQIDAMTGFAGIGRNEKNGAGALLINIGRVMEYGATIKPKHGFLVVPVSREAERLQRRVGSVRNIPDLVRPRNKNGELAMGLYRPAGRGGKKLKLMFALLTKSVIQPRSFIATTYHRIKPALIANWTAAARAALRGRVYVPAQ